MGVILCKVFLLVTSTVCGYVYVYLSGRVRLHRLSHSVVEGLFKGVAVSVILSLLDGARFHVHLLARELLHLIAIGLLDEGLDGVEFGSTSCAYPHLIHFWR